MILKKCLNVFFSPYGGTEKNAQIIVNAIESGSKLPTESLDLLRMPLREERIVETDCLTVVCVPVYAGRVPEPVVRMLCLLKGRNTPAIVAAVYGNRDYDDALLELTDILKKNGFYIFGAAAVLAEHSIFPEIAAGRPDQADREKVVGFVKHCMGLLNDAEPLEENAKRENLIETKGNRPYREPPCVPVKPHVSKACNNCGLCAKLCPVSAIDEKNGRHYDKKVCISCASCIKNCPRHAKAFCGPIYAVGAFGFKSKYSERREPEFFYETKK